MQHKMDYTLPLHLQNIEETSQAYHHTQHNATSDEEITYELDMVDAYNSILDKAAPQDSGNI